MRFPDRETVERLRSEYPVGCRIVLDEMDDPYTKVPVGSQATVTGVDDGGNILCLWDMGSSLSVAWPVDRCHKVSTEEEAHTTIEWYGRHQPDEDARCPRCGKMMIGPKGRHALSRYADITVCDECGTIEALEIAGLVEILPLMKWCCIEVPQNGGGKWKR